MVTIEKGRTYTLSCKQKVMQCTRYYGQEPYWMLKAYMCQKPKYIRTIGAQSYIRKRKSIK